VIPLFLDFTDKRVLIIGGGRVALRKARFFAGRARVTVLSSIFLPGFDELTIERIEGRAEGKLAETLAAFDLVIPATDDGSLNEAVARAAEALGKWVDRVEGVGSVVVPAVLNRGSVAVAISTGGKAPALARYLRERLEELIGPEYGAMADLLGGLRDGLKEKVARQEEREAILTAIVRDEGVWALVKAGDLPGARRRALGHAEAISGEEDR
jgi:precorrin-2 dehydrogenase/sirohydrochlorin ferrochelatase